MRDARPQRPRLPSLRDILPEESLNAPFLHKSHGYPMLPSPTALLGSDMDRLTLAPFAPHPSVFGHHVEQMPPYSSSLRAAAPCLPTPRPSPTLGCPRQPMEASPGASVGLPPCSFDILRPDPQTLTLQHIASSPTRWTAIPAVPNADGDALPARVRASRREYYAPGHNALVDGLGAALRPPPPEAAGQHMFALPAVLAGSAPLLEAHAGASAVQGGWQLNGRHRARPDLRSFAPPARPCSPPASSPSSGGRPDDAPHGVRDEHARKAARAQAEFEREVERRAPPRRRAAHAAAGPSSAPERGAGAADVDADARDRAFVAGVPAKRRKPSDANRTHICPRCSRAFNRPSSLRVHGHKHTGHRPFICPFPECGRTFTVNSNMRRHLRTHFPAGLEGDEESRRMQEAAMSTAGSTGDDESASASESEDW